MKYIKNSKEHLQLTIQVKKSGHYKQTLYGRLSLTSTTLSFQEQSIV